MADAADFAAYWQGPSPDGLDAAAADPGATAAGLAWVPPFAPSSSDPKQVDLLADAAGL